MAKNSLFISCFRCRLNLATCYQNTTRFLQTTLQFWAIFKIGANWGNVLSRWGNFSKLGQNWALTSGKNHPILDAWRRGRPVFGLLPSGGQFPAGWGLGGGGRGAGGGVERGAGGGDGAASRSYVSHAARSKPRGLSRISPT